MHIAHRSVWVVLVFLAQCAVADERDRLKIGVQPDGRILVPTNQILQPAGKQVTFPGRPVDLLLIEGDKTLVAKNMRNVVFIDVATGAIKQTLALPAAAKGLSGAFAPSASLPRATGFSLRIRRARCALPSATTEAASRGMGTSRSSRPRSAAPLTRRE